MEGKGRKENTLELIYSHTILTGKELGPLILVTKKPQSIILCFKVNELRCRGCLPKIGMEKRAQALP